MKTSLFTAACVLILTTHDVRAELLPQTSKPTRSFDIRFNARIRPILSEHCFACHGPDSASRKAKLRLDTPGGALAEGVIVPGKASASELVVRITSNDPDVMMPPPSIRKRPEAKQIELLKRWINAGAKWEAHWAFIKPQKTPLPKPNGIQKWRRNPLDHFVLAKLQTLHMVPAEPADQYALARRAALDLTGLPPIKELVAKLIADQQDGAYGRYVDKLLASPHAGEHRSRYWLDAARYGDTHGMHVDNYREMWPYRDWVVRAFNSGMPFDRFVIEQIAGDLLPKAKLDQRIATGFNRCNITTSEGGAIKEEVNVRYMVDRVETTATVFLGLTAGCAVCHDHKYDPISQREFYQLGAFFNNTTQPPMDGNQKDPPPVVVLPDEKFAKEWDRLQQQRDKHRAELRRWKSTAEKWWTSRAAAAAGQHPIADDELVLWVPLAEGRVAEVAKIQKNASADDKQTQKLAANQPRTKQSIALPAKAEWATAHPAGRRGMRFGDGAGPTVALPKLRSDEPLSISFWMRTPDRLLSTAIFEQTAKTKDGKTVGWKLSSSTQGAMTFELFDAHGKSIRAQLPGEEALTPRAWQHVCIRYSGGQANSSVNILVNGQIGRLRNSTEKYVDATELADAPLKIATRLPTGGLSDVRILKRWVSDEEVRLLADEFDLLRLFKSKLDWQKLEPKDREAVTLYANNVADDKYRARSRELSMIERRRDFIYARSTTTMVMQERDSEPRGWILERGEYDQRRDEVAPGVPAVLDFERADRKGRTRNRLDLARWLVHGDHPLTARVTVNRLWQSVFGTGLVKTSEDFGVMGERPSHPELLDWLAVEFIESGWNVNHILKLIVTSATYRQASAVTVEKLEKDKDNRFFSRAPRLRLDAEVLRDQALSISGLLRRDMGGPSVRPYQPVGLWRVVAITGSNTRDFKRDSGEALYRRSLYTFWKRTSPPPSMAAFNAPTREQCTVRRERTNTPLQALVLMNDPQFVEAARRLAENSLKQQMDDRTRATWMLESVLSRPAVKVDLTDTLAAAREFRQVFSKQTAAAKSLIAIGDSKPDAKLDTIELATWTMVANTLMNRDDFINK